MKKNTYDVLKSPIITEKATRNTAEINQYTFRVRKDANKTDIHRAIETIYSVDVQSVNVMNVKGKTKSRGVRRNPGKTSGWKKALVKLKEGQTIDFT